MQFYLHLQGTERFLRKKVKSTLYLPIGFQNRKFYKKYGEKFDFQLNEILVLSLSTKFISKLNQLLTFYLFIYL